MGVWGTKIEDNDTFADVYGYFYELYNSGSDPFYASTIVEKEYSHEFKDQDNYTNAWFALAFAQWETKSLDAAVFDKVSTIISNGDDLRRWKQDGCADSVLLEREQCLTGFLELISKPRKTKKRRKKIKNDFKLNTLVELEAPDNKKVFTVTEEFDGDRYIHTSAMMMWGSGGGSVFYYTKQSAKVDARWVDDDKLEVILEKNIEFTKQDHTAFFCGDQISITYIYE